MCRCSTHMIGHELTTVHGLDHAQTLAVILLAVRRTEKAQKLLQYAERVWGIEEGMSYPYSMALDGRTGRLESAGRPCSAEVPDLLCLRALQAVSVLAVAAAYRGRSGLQGSDL